MQKDVVMLILFLICLWLILDQIVGKKLIGQFVTSLISSFN